MTNTDLPPDPVQCMARLASLNLSLTISVNALVLAAERLIEEPFSPSAKAAMRVAITMANQHKEAHR
jgi:hypothetical protein